MLVEPGLARAEATVLEVGLQVREQSCPVLECAQLRSHLLAVVMRVEVSQVSRAALRSHQKW